MHKVYMNFNEHQIVAIETRKKTAKFLCFKYISPLQSANALKQRDIFNKQYKKQWATVVPWCSG